MMVKMKIDKKTQINWLNIVIDNKAEYLKELKDQAEEEGQNEDGANNLSISLDKHSFEMYEYYFDDKENELVISGTLKSPKGETYFGITIPLSDIVLISILEYALKRLDKLKNVLEALN